ncbi:hypothetical protein [Candidatus Korobacter versatilis]|uniref:hypothetical protein n=1 Tax=Candidatus Korobacter versatilis TaxID=658062 RepID=UPI00031D319C|nr:hypothetical protein [Candidatus Koribacter versatilis]
MKKTLSFIVWIGLCVALAVALHRFDVPTLLFCGIAAVVIKLQDIEQAIKAQRAGKPEAWSEIE